MARPGDQAAVHPAFEVEALPVLRADELGMGAVDVDGRGDEPGARKSLATMPTYFSASLSCMARVAIRFMPS
jgi:hypothetical protein